MTTQSTRIAALNRTVRRIDAEIATLEKQSDTMANVRLAIAVLGIFITLALFLTEGMALFGWLSLVLFGGGFAFIVRQHRAINRSITRHQLWRDHKQAHIARATLDWNNVPAASLRVQRRHMLEIDLDLLDLHRLIDVTTSHAGAERLRSWLVPTVPDIDIINTRQARVAELAKQPLFRDKLYLHAREAAEEALSSRGDGRQLLTWLREQPANPRTDAAVLGLLSVLSLLNIAQFALSITGILPLQTLPSLTFLLYSAVFISQYRRVFTTFEEALTVQGALERIHAVMHYLETRSYAAMPHTRQLVAPVLEQRPSATLRGVTWVISGASLRANPIFWLVINLIIPWDYFFGWRLAVVKRGLDTSLPAWLDVWHELEALSSLATLAYLNPTYTLPRVDNDVPAAFDAVQIGHPLIPAHQRVCNDFMLADTGDTAVITGSNMSGKSSFLRALGVNLSLAYAGSYVCAHALDTIAFRLYTSIRVTDSLDDGISYFYAEVKRLKGLLEALNAPDSPPLFFLIDEIFRGTNNRERLIGSRAMIRALASGNGVGLIATHDLELVALSDENPHIRNVHFREDVLDGRMVFDYILRSGPCPTTNALRIMAMEGLPVDPDNEAKRRRPLRRRNRDNVTLTEPLPPGDTVEPPDAAVEVEAEDSDTDDPTPNTSAPTRRRRLLQRNRPSATDEADTVEEQPSDNDDQPDTTPSDDAPAPDDAS